MREDELSSIHVSLERSLYPNEIIEKVNYLHSESKEKNRKLNDLRKSVDKVLNLFKVGSITFSTLIIQKQQDNSNIYIR